MLIMLALLSVWPRWPPSPAGIGVGSEVSGEEFDSKRAATSRLQTHRNEWNRWDSDCGGRNILWGTQQGHLPGAMWWLRRFYTVAFVCLFRLGSLPGGAAGQPSVVIYLISSFTTLSLLSLLPIFSSFLAVAAPEICCCHCEWRLTLTRFVTFIDESSVEPTLTSGLLFRTFFVLVCDWTEAIIHPVGEDDGVNGRIRREQTSSHKCLCRVCSRLQHLHAELHPSTFTRHTRFKRYARFTLASVHPSASL